ncbi:MAG: LppX_LprAFG lipoprotein [Pseudonocardiales bacterium]
MPRRYLCLFALLTALLTACGGLGGEQDSPPTLPDGAELLADSATAMRTVTTTRVGIDVQGDLPTLPIRTAEGQLTREGQAKGTATVDQFGQLIELDFVIVDDKLYLRGPTGGIQELPAASAGLVYDSSVILDPDRGVAGVLASGAAARTEAREQLGELDCYRVQASFSGQSLSKLVPGFTQDTTGQVWIAAEGFYLVQARFPTTGGVVTFRFSDFDEPADITAPN